MTLDKLNRCFLFGSAEEIVHHILLHCPVVRSLWELIFPPMGFRWVFPSTVKEATTSWRGAPLWEKKEAKSGDQSLFAFFGQSGTR